MKNNLENLESLSDKQMEEMLFGDAPEPTTARYESVGIFGPDREKEGSQFWVDVEAGTRRDPRIHSMRDPRVQSILKAIRK